MNFTCPNCHNRHVKRLALLWAEGLSKTRSNHVSVGVGGVFDFLKSLPYLLIGLPLILIWSVFAGAFSFLGTFFMIGRSWGTSQTVLSEESKPPYRFRVGIAALKGLAFVLVFGFVAMVWVQSEARSHPAFMETVAWMFPFDKSFFTAVIFGLTPVLAIYAGGLWLGVHYNRHIWPKREAVWQRSFFCNRCGTVFVVPDFTPAGSNVIRSDRAGKGGLLPVAADDKARAQAESQAGRDEYLLRKRAKAAIIPFDRKPMNED